MMSLTMQQSSRLRSELLSSLTDGLGAYRLWRSLPLDRLLLRTWPRLPLLLFLLLTTRASSSFCKVRCVIRMKGWVLFMFHSFTFTSLGASWPTEQLRISFIETGLPRERRCFVVFGQDDLGGRLELPARHFGRLRNW